MRSAAFRKGFSARRNRGCGGPGFVSTSSQVWLPPDSGTSVESKVTQAPRTSARHMRSAKISRLRMRRFTWLTNAFTKKAENHAYAVALHFMHYNFCRIHKTLRVTPAMAAGITDKLWEMTDLVRVIEDRERAQAIS